MTLRPSAPPFPLVGLERGSCCSLRHGPGGAS
jgi:hypothetical protein